MSDDLFIGIYIYVNYSINSIMISNSSIQGNANFRTFKNYRRKEIEIVDKFGSRAYNVKDIDIALFDMVQYFDSYNIRIKTV